MRKTLIVLAIPALVFCFQDTGAQSIRSLMRQKVIDKVLEDQAESDSIRAVEEGREPDQSPNTTMTHVYLDALGLSGNVAYQSSYEFDAHMEMVVSNYDEKGKLEDQSRYDTYVNKGSIDYGMVFGDKGEKTTVIYDDGNSAMLILTDSDGEKTGLAMGIDKSSYAEAQGEDVSEEEVETGIPGNLRKTGRTKTILGYSCDEYLAEDEEAEVRMWVSEKLGKEVRKEMLNNQQYFGGTFYYADRVEGAVLEYDFLDKEDGERVVMQVTGIDLNGSHTISTREYAVLTMKAPPVEEEEEEK